MALTTEFESSERKEKLNTRAFLLAIFLIFFVGILAFLRYSIIDRNYKYFSKVFTVEFNRLDGYSHPYVWHYLGSIDQSEISPNGAYWNPMFAATKTPDGNYLVAVIMIDASIHENQTYNPDRVGCPSQAYINKEFFDAVLQDPGSKATTQILADMSFDSNDPDCHINMQNVFYDVNTVGVGHTTWAPGSLFFRKTAEDLTKE
jgi:hypothetical protein